MKIEDNNRMEALAYIIADLKAENMMMTERVHQLTDDYNNVARQLRGMEKRKDEDPAKQTLSEMQQMRDHCDNMEIDNKQLRTFAKEINIFIKDKKLYMGNDTSCPYKKSCPLVCSTSCLECDSNLGLIGGFGVICKARLSEAKISFPSNE